MPRPPNRPDRRLYNHARVELALASAAGSTAWSLAGRAAAPGPEHRLDRRALIEPADRALPIVNRN
ncbi:hypothetical protein [Rubrivirga marina]|uniref:Uncharacterized protein n=1 Tax=Rubrivirga marina TaxID=1196024 RepID=A0A271J0N8_9BACT|nr:hypothetical protein [Rubrivirga marina]PAP77081.1 hypothetical protein BSZ37_11910 [Rubrivirga marina]